MRRMTHLQRGRLRSAASPAGPEGAGYKYREVVRKRAERAALPGYECPDCTRFYTALESWGPLPGLPPGGLPACGHAAPGACVQLASATLPS